MKFLRLFILIFIIPFITNGQLYHRTDTLFIPETKISPVIDGVINDDAWQLAEWNSIEQIWMPYNNDPANLGQEGGLKLWEGEHDFSGRYKTVWSSESNLLYFIVEITDDVFTDGYVYNENPNSGGNYPHYDILEIFIDEDRSGGLHVFDGTGNVANSWGTNAENAFSYHLAADAPDNGNIQSDFHALDIAGTNWGYPNQKVADYADHFPEFVLKKEGNVYTWEFSLKVHDDSYNHADQELSVVNLYAGKIFGLTLAYCDNDDPFEIPLRRDHFFGSVEVPLHAHNEHWKQADWFGVAKLTSEPSTSLPQIIQNQIKIDSYLANGKLHTSVESPFPGSIGIRVLNILGREIHAETFQKTGGMWSSQFDHQNWQSGIYLVEIIHGNKRSAKKFIIH
jgi:hypothetical protein